MDSEMDLHSVILAWVFMFAGVWGATIVAGAMLYYGYLGIEALKACAI